MGQARRNIFFQLVGIRQTKFLIIAGVVILDNFNQPVFLEGEAAVIVNAGIKQAGDL